MIQEIITYIIIALAFIFTFLRFRRKFINKKRNKKRTTGQALYKEAQIHQHKCSDCAAECVLRDVGSNMLKSNDGMCRKVETASASD